MKNHKIEKPDNSSEEKLSLISAWKEDVNDAPSWGEFFDPDPVREWSRDVRQALHVEKTSESWKLTGPCVAIESDDLEECALLLKRVALENELIFARIPAVEIQSLADNLRTSLCGCAPLLVVIDWGDWATGEDDEGTSLAKRIRKGLARFDPERPVLFATCCEDLSDLSLDLQVAGAFDRHLVLQSSSPAFVGQRFLNMLGPDVADEKMLGAPMKIGLVILNEFKTRDVQEAVALRMRRLARREGKRVGLNDLIELTIRGLGEASKNKVRVPAEISRKRTALHEAGHACIAVIASAGANLPDYASIVPARDFEGIVLESLAFHEAREDFTFDDLVLRARIALAGRAAEEYFFGPRQVSSGADSDLSRVTRITFKLFAYSGFHSGMERGESSAVSLAVLPRGEVDSVQFQRINRDVRGFISEQYQYVLRTLGENRVFVEEVANRLLWDPVVDQLEIRELAQRHGIAVIPL